MLSKGKFGVKIVQNANSTDSNNFRNINELICNAEDKKLQKNMQELFDLDAAELYKTVVVEVGGKPVAAGSLNITIAPI